MAKLHELLAVETDVAGQANTCRTDLTHTFEKKAHLFSKSVVTFKSDIEGVPDKTESRSDLQTTVRGELDWIGAKISKAMDVGHQVDTANTLAAADVILDDAAATVLLKNVPTTSLLRIAHRLTEIKALITAIGTLDPAKAFTPDPLEPEGVFKARDEVKPKTEQVFDYVVMVQPTERHPAQVKELMPHKKIGETLTQTWSSLITVREKGEMLDRVETVIRAVKKARARANEYDLDVRSHIVGAKVLDYVFSGKA